MMRMARYDFLDVHFLNVGHGDCTIIRHPGSEKRKEGRISVVDIHDWDHLRQDESEELVAGLSSFLKSSLSSGYQKHISEEEYAEEYLDDPVSYYQDEFSDVKNSVWRFISTHPDMDHLAGIKQFHEEIGFEVMWDTNHSKTLDTGDGWNEKFNREDWYRYKKIRQGDSDTKAIRPGRGSQKNFWEQDNIQILHPTGGFVDDVDSQSGGYNNASYVLKIKHGSQSFLLPGDVEEEAWKGILDYWPTDVLSDINILKASHHGRKSGFYRPAIEVMDPDTVIVSVGNKDEHDGYYLYRDACSSNTDILSTRQYGTVQAISTGRRTSIQLAEPDGIFDTP
jgi:beta-lactamase superfamily II metal-dependent hydrolase